MALIRLIRSELFINFVVFPGKVLIIFHSNVRYIRCTVQYTYIGDMAWHVYLALVLPRCHFLNIFASKMSRKNKGKVSNFFGQSVTNDTSTPG